MKDLILFSIHLIFLFLLYFRRHGIKKGEIFDLMQKIWIKKEMYFLSYEFLKFLTFFGFEFDFY